MTLVGAAAARLGKGRTGNVVITSFVAFLRLDLSVLSAASRREVIASVTSNVVADDEATFSTGIVEVFVGKIPPVSGCAVMICE